MTGRIIRRSMAALASITIAVAAGTAPAGAHGAGSDGTEVPNYVTIITDSGDPDLDWSIDIAHARIRLANTTDQTVIVYGYRAEPYLRFDPDGAIWSNANSPTTYLNQHRYGDAQIPPTAGSSAEPDWQPVGDGGTHVWWDHRAHWMATEAPVAVTADPDQTHLLSTWTIPLRVGDTDTGAHGEIRWEPDRAWWPPIVALTAAFAGIAAVALATTRPESGRWPQPAHVLAGLIAVVAVANTVRGIDEALNVADTTSGAIVVAISALVAAAAIGALAWHGREGRVRGYGLLLGAAFLVAIIFGGASGHEITDPQLVTGLPAWFRRWTVAASYAIVVPAGLTAIIAGRRHTAADASGPAATFVPDGAH